MQFTQHNNQLLAAFHRVLGMKIQVQNISKETFLPTQLHKLKVSFTVCGQLMPEADCWSTSACLGLISIALALHK